MKAARRLTITIGLGVLLSAATAQAQFSHETNNATITITGYTGPGDAVTIPDTINGLPVTRIADDAFNACSWLNSVTIPTSVTRIGDRAFMFCSSLTSTVIGNGMAEIGVLAFYGCDSLTHGTYGSGAIFFGQNSCPEGPVTIPDTIKGLPMTSIGSTWIQSLHQPDERDDSQQCCKDRECCICEL